MINAGKHAIIIGAMAAGAGVAARLRRLDESIAITLIERSNYISYASCGIPYWIGGQITEFERLVQNSPENFSKMLNIDVRINHEVKRIDCAAKTVDVAVLATGERVVLSYDFLILATGSKPTPLAADIEDGVVIYTVKILEDAIKLKQSISGGVDHVTIIGSGFIGLEVAENLHTIAGSMTIVEARSYPLTALDEEMASRIIEEIYLHSIDLKLGSTIKKILVKNGRYEVLLSTGIQFSTDLIISTIGYQPHTELAEAAGIVIGPGGGIAVDASLRTSEPAVWAAGDVADIKNSITGQTLPQPFAGPAAQQARVIADTIAGSASTYSGCVGAWVMHFFNLTIAAVGANTQTLNRCKINHQAIHLSQHDHATYFGHPELINFKLLFHPETGRILGMQAIGATGVEKRIDVVSALMQKSGTVDDLATLEMCYAPAYNAQRDPLNNLGYVAQNSMKGYYKSIDAVEYSLKKTVYTAIDVRSAAEYEARHLENSRNIPLEQLRGAIQTLPRDRPVVTLCATGKRSYFAARILMHNGFTPISLDGGITAFRAATESVEEICARIALRKNVSVIDPHAFTPDHTLDVIGLACPGPITRLQSLWSNVKDGEIVLVRVNDSSFIGDVPEWCERNNGTILGISPELEETQGVFTIFIRRTLHEAAAAEAIVSPPPVVTTQQPSSKTFLIASDVPEKVMVAFMAATTWASLGERVILFFIFAGINILRKNQMYTNNAPLYSKVGINAFIVRAGSAPCAPAVNCQVFSIAESLEQLEAMGAEFMVCAMSMKAMGLSSQDLRSGIKEVGMMTFVSEADASNVTMSVF
ncbi:MAG: FAD-dependent oxidoreductase [Chitinivibrionales bacterium]|nr:FAD-dependent oxidoreductase [Chitinivibrionales bacterium]